MNITIQINKYGLNNLNAIKNNCIQYLKYLCIEFFPSYAPFPYKKRKGNMATSKVILDLHG